MRTGRRSRAATWALLTLVAGFVLLSWIAWRQLFPHRAEPPAAPLSTVERQARRYVALALTLGKLAPGEVDSYFGPADIRPVTGKPSLPELRADLADLAAELRDGSGPADGRRARLERRTERLLALVDAMGPVPRLPFDDEASRIYGLPRLTVDSRAMARARARLDHLLPGEAPLYERVQAFRRSFLIPPERRAAVFERAVAECRRRTLLHWRLPRSERLEVRWTDSVDAAWHRYRGGFRSTLEINPEAVAFLGSVVQVACHEAYPGHHVQFTLSDMDAGAAGLPIEDRVVLLRSPGSVLREGAAEVGAGLVFSPLERLAFDRDVLMPLARLPGADAARFEEVRALLDELAPAAFPILRAYRDGRLDPVAAATALQRDALVASPQPLLAFTDSAGAYVAGYTVVREEVRRLLYAPGPGDPWTRLRCLLAADDDDAPRWPIGVNGSPLGCARSVASMMIGAGVAPDHVSPQPAPTGSARPKSRPVAAHLMGESVSTTARWRACRYGGKYVGGEAESRRQRLSLIESKSWLASSPD